MYSVGALGGDAETTRALYRAVLLVGGGALTRQLPGTLEARLRARLPRYYGRHVDAVDVLARPRVRFNLNPSDEGEGDGGLPAELLDWLTRRVRGWAWRGGTGRT